MLDQVTYQEQQTSPTEGSFNTSDIASLADLFTIFIKIDRKIKADLKTDVQTSPRGNKPNCPLTNISSSESVLQGSS